MSVTYRMSGAVCGTCSHRHISIHGAASCAVLHERFCDARGGYSDRRLVAFDDGARREATTAELSALALAIENFKAARPRMVQA